MSTVSSDLLMAQLRNRLLGFTPLTGASLNTRLGGIAAGSGRLYKDFPPDTVVWPYAILRLINRLTPGEYAGERESSDLEVMLYARPRANAAALEDAADVCDAAMLRYRDSSSGLTFTQERQRDTLPPPSAPADREVVQIRLLYSIKSWPIYLSQYSAGTA